MSAPTAAGVDPVTAANIRLTVARMYRARRRYENADTAARGEMHGWASTFAAEYLDTGRASMITAYYFAVARDYVDAAERLRLRRAARRALAGAS